MRKGLSALIALSIGLIPFASKAATAAAETCTSFYSGGGLLNGVCQECFDKGQCQIMDFFVVGNTVSRLILGLSGSLMLLMIIYGGFLWLTSSGNSAMVDKGKKVLIGSIVGLIIVFGAYTATQFLVASVVCKNDTPANIKACAATVNEIFSRPFQNSKGKVVTPK